MNSCCHLSFSHHNRTAQTTRFDMPHFVCPPNRKNYAHCLLSWVYPPMYSNRLLCRASPAFESCHLLVTKSRKSVWILKVSRPLYIPSVVGQLNLVGDTYIRIHKDGAVHFVIASYDAISFPLHSHSPLSFSFFLCASTCSQRVRWGAQPLRTIFGLCKSRWPCSFWGFEIFCICLRCRWSVSTSSASSFCERDVCHRYGREQFVFPCPSKNETKQKKHRRNAQTNLCGIFSSPFTYFLL